MCGVPGQKDSPFPHSGGAALVESVNAGPDYLERPFPDNSANPFFQGGRLAFGLRINILAQLPVNSPDAIGLGMQQRRFAPVKYRVEPEPPLVWKIEFSLY